MNQARDIDPTGTVRGKVVKLLELTASHAPELLPFAAELLRAGPLRFAVAELAADWGIGLELLPTTVELATLGLDTLDRHRSRWRDPATVLDAPNVGALAALAEARLARVTKPAPRRRLNRVCLKLRRVAEHQRGKQWIVDFLAESPGAPLRDPERYGL